MPLVKGPGSTKMVFQGDALVLHPFRAAILEKMPLMERGGPQVDEEAEESKEARLSEAAPVPTEPQVRRVEALE